MGASMRAFESLSVRGRIGAALAVLIALIAALLVAVTPPAPAHADATDTGTGGRFVAASGRILDTRSGTGGYSTAMPAGGYRSIQVGGKAGVPTSGVGAVVVNVTAVNMTQQGEVRGRPDGSTASALMLVFDGGGLGTTSNTATIAVGDDGTIQVASDVVTDLVIDVQGYYTANDDGTAAGGFVSVPGTRIVDSRNGTGVSKAQIAAGSSVTFQVTGNGGVPAGASAVVANFIVIPAANGGYITPYPAGTSKPQRSLQYAAGVPTSLTAQVALSSDGKLIVADDVNAIDLAVDVQGYFTATNGGGSVFTPAAGTVYDTRISPNTALAGQETRAIPVSGQAGVPAVGSGVTAVALTLTALHAANSGGNATVYADGAAKPATTSISFAGNSIRTNTVIVAVGSNGKIDLGNYSSDSTDYVLELQGWYNALPTGPSKTGLTGKRPSATNLSFPIDDQTSAQVDVGTGNLLIANKSLILPGVKAPTSIGAAYNSRGWQSASSVSIDANRWEYALDGAGSLSAGSTGVIYTGADGSTWQFTANSDGTYTSVAGLQATLVKTSTEYKLTFWTSAQVDHFNLNGQPTSVVDSNGNTVKMTYNGATLTGVVTSAGPSLARTAAVSYSNGTTTFTQTNGSATRSLHYSKDGNGNITSYTDADGAVTSFGYTGQDLTSITAPTGAVTTITYDSSDRVTEVDQQNTSAGSPGTSTTRLTYPSSSQTLVAGPDTDATQAVSAVPHTTYTVDSTNHLVTTAVDAAGRSRSAQYSSANMAPTSSTVGTGSGAGTSNYQYNANSGQSLTQAQSPGGSSSSATYHNTGATAYLPDTVTDGAGNTQNLTYDGQGNIKTSSSGSGSDAATATLTYNSNGTVATALAPGNGSNTTKYGYTKPDGTTDNQLTTITPVTGVGLGTKTYTYDAYGRLATASDGATGSNGTARTQTYTYDNDDRLLSTAYSDSTPTVTNRYDGNGNLLTVTAQSGTQTNTWDQLNHMLRTVNTAGGGAENYSYDKAGNELTSSDSFGTYANTFDASGVLTKTTYPANGGTQAINYKTDPEGRRTDTWLNANADNSTWGVHQQQVYDTSGRVSEIKVYTGTGNSDNNLIEDTQYCYNSATDTSSCSTATGTDNAKLQWTKDLTDPSQLTKYKYDTAGRLLSATESGGSNGNLTNTYTYDSRGNRLSDVHSGDNTDSQHQTFNAANETTNTGWTYDGAGNRTATDSGTYTYNAAEQMTQSDFRATTTTYTYGGSDQNELLSEATAGGDTASITYGRTDPQGQPEITQYAKDYGSGHVFSDPVTGQPLLLTSSRGSNSLYLYDGLGNPTAVIASDPNSITPAAYSYDPYGLYNLTSSEAGAPEVYENPYTFKGGITDDTTGLTKFGARWYDDYYGTWTQEDTLDQPLDPSNANRYAYAGDDPINGTDPTGAAGIPMSGCTASLLGLGFGAIGLAGVAVADAAAIVGGVTAPAAIGITSAEVAGVGGWEVSYNTWLQKCG
ncbi:hypothetical protein DEI81_10535 [Curtobacterium sp. MCBD17_013]|nr:hypothetical protein DEI81_10535 [Curtobacterium sp. MCBD17_013]